MSADPTNNPNAQGTFLQFFYISFEYQQQSPKEAWTQSWTWKVWVWEDVMQLVVPELPEAGGHSCEVCGCRTPPCSQTGADVGQESAQSLPSRRCTAAPAQGQLQRPEGTATHSQASPPLTRCTVCQPTWLQSDTNGEDISCEQNTPPGFLSKLDSCTEIWLTNVSRSQAHGTK